VRAGYERSGERPERVRVARRLGGVLEGKGLVHDAAFLRRWGLGRRRESGRLGGPTRGRPLPHDERCGPLPEPERYEAGDRR